MTTNDTYWTLQTAINHGGGFYRRLAEATLHADPDNKQRVMLAFQSCSSATAHRPICTAS